MVYANLCPLPQLNLFQALIPILRFEKRRFLQAETNKFQYQLTKDYKAGGVLKKAKVKHLLFSRPKLGKDGTLRLANFSHSLHFANVPSTEVSPPKEEAKNLIVSPNPFDTNLDKVVGGDVVYSDSLMDDDGYAQIEEEVWFGRVPSLEKFVKVIETRIEKKKTDRIQEVISLMWELQIPFNAEIYHNIISKLLESGDTQCIITFLESISKHNNNEGFLTSHWLFRLAVKDGDMIIAKQCFSLMFRHGYVRKNETHAEFLKCVGTGNFQMLSDCLNLRQMLLLLKEFARRESVDEILALFSLTAELGLILDTACYDVALEVLIRRAPAMGMRLFLAMKKNSLTPPSSQTYLIVIRGLLLRNNHFEGAAAIRERIPLHMRNPRINQTIDNYILAARLKHGPLEVALSFFRNLLDRKEVNLRTFYILTAYIVEKDHIRSRRDYKRLLDQLVADLELSGIRPNNFLFNKLVKGYLNANLLEKAEAIHNRRLQAGIRPDVFTYSIFITYFANVAKDIARGVHWVEMQVAAGITPIGKPIGDLLILIKRSKDIASIRKMQVLLRRSNFLPNLDDHIERYIHNVLNGHVHINRPPNFRRPPPSTENFNTLGPYFEWDGWY